MLAWVVPDAAEGYVASETVESGQELRRIFRTRENEQEEWNDTSFYSGRDRDAIRLLVLMAKSESAPRQ